MKNNTATSFQSDYEMMWLDENDFFGNMTYSDTSANIHKNEAKRFSNLYQANIAEQFKNMQDSVMNKEMPILSKLLNETAFEEGYESFAERYFNQLSDKYGIIADTILQNIYLQNMYDNSTLLFIIGNLPANRRNNLEIVPLAGLSNPDIEIQDLSVKCFEAWEDKRHLPTLINLRDQTNVQWFKDYISDVIAELSED